MAVSSDLPRYPRLRGAPLSIDVRGVLESRHRHLPTCPGEVAHEFDLFVAGGVTISLAREIHGRDCSNVR